MNMQSTSLPNDFARDAPRNARPGNGGRNQGLSFRFGIATIPHPEKVDKGGEDAAFAHSKALGVFDGVGSWTKQGVDPGLYSAELSQKTANRITSVGCSASIALAYAFFTTKTHGSSTACVVDITNGRLEGINLGDSGLVVIRNGETVYKTIPLTHGFNRPYQIGRSPEGASGDPLSSGDTIDFTLSVGDVIIMGSDGLWDNVFEPEILRIVTKYLCHISQGHKNGRVSSPFTRFVPNQLESRWQKAIATSLARRASKVATSTDLDSPFADDLKKMGMVRSGGKLDDITVISAIVVNDAE